jgi:hypothetical protein
MNHNYSSGHITVASGYGMPAPHLTACNETSIDKRNTASGVHFSGKKKALAPMDIAQAAMKNAANAMLALSQIHWAHA